MYTSILTRHSFFHEHLYNHTHNYTNIANFEALDVNDDGCFSRTEMQAALIFDKHADPCLRSLTLRGLKRAILDLKSTANPASPDFFLLPDKKEYDDDEWLKSQLVKYDEVFRFLIASLLACHLHLN